MPTGDSIASEGSTAVKMVAAGVDNHYISFDEQPKPRSFDPIDIGDFESLGIISSESSVSHTIDKGRLRGSSDIWYRKEFSNPAAARREWLAQEFLRLIIPNQTETRLAYDPISKVHFILSKEVPGFRPLPTHQQAKFNNGTYKGLGHIIIGAYFVHEADLKNGNIGIGDDNVVYKIDGDWSFASMRSNSQFPKHTGAIAAVQINRLPFPMTYKAHNWLDIFIEGSLASASDIVSSDIGSNPQFQQEKFETLFKLLLIPDRYFVQFVDSFMPAGAKEYSDFLIERRNTLFKQASKIQGFVQFLKDNDEELEELAIDFQEEMESFVIQGNYPIVDTTKYPELCDHFKSQFSEVYNKLNIPHDVVDDDEFITSSVRTPFTDKLDGLGIFSSCHCGSKRKIEALIEDYFEPDKHRM